MSESVREFILDKAKEGDIDGYDPTSFALDSPKAKIKQTQSGGSDVRPSEAPKQRISEFRTVADTDPHVGEGIDTLVDFLVGSGFSVQPANIPGTEEAQTDEDISDLKWLIETSTFETELISWVWHALVDGTGFLEIVVEDDTFKPKVLPTERMLIQTNEEGDTTGYEMEPPGGGGGQDENTEFDLYDVAVLTFHKHPGEDFGRSAIEPAQEQADMLRDMEIDLARFVSTKAYPPILWKLGSEERPWSQPQIDGWLEELENIEPESQLAVSHDVDHEVVGVTSTSSDSGALDLESTFHHLQKRVAAGLGVPAFLLNMEIDMGRNTSVAVMPKFDRRIQRYRRSIRQAVRHQIFVSILAGDSDPEEGYDELPPDFEFGQHSSEEERLDADMAIKLVNNNLLTFKAAAKRLDIDPETELPDNVQDLSGEEQIQLLQILSGTGDGIQNPDGGSPTDTEGGAESSGQEVKSRDAPEQDNSDGRPKQDVTS